MKKSIQGTPLKFIELPKPAAISNIRHKLTYAIGCIYLISSVGLIAGVRQFGYILAIMHILQSAIFDNPLVTTTQGQYDTKLRSLIFDVALLGAVLMLSGYKFSEKKVAKKEKNE